MRLRYRESFSAAEVDTYESLRVSRDRWKTTTIKARGSYHALSRRFLKSGNFSQIMRFTYYSPNRTHSTDIWAKKIASAFDHFFSNLVSEGTEDSKRVTRGT